MKNWTTKQKVTNNRDPYKQGRIKVEGGKWIAPLAGAGAFIIPDEGKEVTIIDEEFYIGGVGCIITG